MRSAISSPSSILRLSIASLKYVRSVSKIPAIPEPEIREKPKSEPLSHSPADPHLKTKLLEKIGSWSGFRGYSSSSSTGCSQDSKSTSETPPETTLHWENEVIDGLISRVDDPQSALKWVQTQHGFTGRLEVFCVLIYILMRSRETLGYARILIKEYISAPSCPSPAVLVGRLIDCTKKFDFLRNDRVFEHLLDCYISSDQIEPAIECFDSMIRGDVIPRFPYINKFFVALLRRDMIDELRDFYSRMVKKGLHGNPVTVRAMRRSLLKNGKVEEVEEYFQELKRSGAELDAWVYDTVIQAVYRKHDSKLSVGLLEEMKEMGWVPSEATFHCVMLVCADEGNVVEALRVKDMMMSCGKPMTLEVADILMQGYFNQGNPDGALNLYNNIMEDGLVPNRTMYLILIIGCCETGVVEKASELYAQMKRKGILPNVNVMNLLLKGYLQASLREEASKLFDEAVDRGWADIVTYGLMIPQLCEEGKMDEACSLWDCAIGRGMVFFPITYECMIRGHCRKGNTDKASSLFSDMLESSLMPDVRTCSILIDVLFKEGDKEKALDIFDRMVRSGIAPDDSTYNAIIDGLCSVGCSSEARDAMKKFLKIDFLPSTDSFNCLVQGFILEDDINSALGAYREMCELGVPPDVCTYPHLIQRLFRTGKIDLAQKLMDEVKDKGLELEFTAVIDEACKKMGIEVDNIPSKCSHNYKR